jgi:hypothetical protein
LSRDADKAGIPTHIKSRTGTRQGDALSPTLYCLGFNDPLMDILNYVHLNSTKVQTQTDGDDHTAAVEGFVMGYLDDVSGAIDPDILVNFLKYVYKQFINSIYYTHYNITQTNQLTNLPNILNPKG